MAADPVHEPLGDRLVVHPGRHQELDGGLLVQLGELHRPRGEYACRVVDGRASGDDEAQARVRGAQRRPDRPHAGDHRRTPVLGLLEGVHDDQEGRGRTARRGRAVNRARAVRRGRTPAGGRTASATRAAILRASSCSRALARAWKSAE